MFTNIFSYIFIKKNKKLLKQNSVDKFARLPHPSELNKKKGRKKKINSAQNQDKINKGLLKKRQLKDVDAEIDNTESEDENQELGALDNLLK